MNVSKVFDGNRYTQTKSLLVKINFGQLCSTRVNRFKFCNSRYVVTVTLGKPRINFNLTSERTSDGSKRLYNRNNAVKISIKPSSLLHLQIVCVMITLEIKSSNSLRMNEKREKKTKMNVCYIELARNEHVKTESKNVKNSAQNFLMGTSLKCS